MKPDWHLLDGTDTDVGTLRLLTAWMQWQVPRVVVESGTYRGYGMVALAQGLALVRPEGRVYTADPFDWGQDALAEELELQNTAIFRGDFVAMLDTIPDPIDFGWIDAGPGPGMDTDLGPIRWTHWQAAKARLAPGGVLLCHDTACHDWAGAREIVADGAMTLPYGRGLTFYRKPE